jgi:hypothetical protein
MPAANTDKFLKATRKRAGALDSSGISSAVIDNFGLDSGSGLPTDTAISIVIDRVDSNGVKTPAKEEEIIGVVSGDQIVNAVRGVSGTAQSHAAGAVWEIRLTAAQWNRMVEGMLAEHGQDGKHSIAALDGIRYAADAGGDDTYAVTLSPVPAAYYAGMEVNFKPTTANTGACTLDVNGLGAKTIKKSVSSDLATGDILAGQLVKVIYDGTNFQLVNTPVTMNEDYKIEPTVASNNLTLALKDKDGNDFSASNPLRLKIDTVVNVITSAISFTKNAGTNYGNAGSAELATKEIDWFLYAIQETGGSAGVKFGYSRIPFARKMGDFVNTTTSEKYIAGNWTNFNSTDKVCVIGRFAATLSASASYNWSIPTFDSTNLINEPVFETRWLDFATVFTAAGGTAPTFGSLNQNKYKIAGNHLYFHSSLQNTSGGTAGAGAVDIYQNLPFSGNSLASTNRGMLGVAQVLGTINLCLHISYRTANTICLQKSATNNVLANEFASAAREMYTDGHFEI